MLCDVVATKETHTVDFTDSLEVDTCMRCVSCNYRKHGTTVEVYLVKSVTSNHNKVIIILRLKIIRGEDRDINVHSSI